LAAVVVQECIVIIHQHSGVLGDPPKPGVKASVRATSRPARWRSWGFHIERVCERGNALVLRL